MSLSHFFLISKSEPNLHHNQMLFFYWINDILDQNYYLYSAADIYMKFQNNKFPAIKAIRETRRVSSLPKANFPMESPLVVSSVFTGLFWRTRRVNQLPHHLYVFIFLTGLQVFVKTQKHISAPCSVRPTIYIREKKKSQKQPNHLLM